MNETLINPVHVSEIKQRGPLHTYILGLMLIQNKIGIVEEEVEMACGGINNG